MILYKISRKILKIQKGYDPKSNKKKIQTPT